ncbi:MAG: nicotinamide mononucleotide transporter family protein [Bacteroidota bacterium]
MSQLRQPLLRKIVYSPSIDLFAAALILGVSVVRNFHGTVYQNGEIQFGVPFSDLWSTVTSGAFPLGIFSIVGAIFSVLATRLVGKQNNFGNLIAILTTISSGVIDYLFGNHSAVITYPLTFILHNIAFSKWKKGEKIRKRDMLYYLINLGGILVGFALVFLGAYLFGGRTDVTFLTLVSLIFGLSLGANFSNAFKYEETWLSWMIYNTIQLGKNALQLNLANVAKYIFYLFNAGITLFDWKLNGDASKGGGE